MSLNPTYCVWDPKKRKPIDWRDVRIGFVGPLESTSKTFFCKMDSFPLIVGQLHKAAILTGMNTPTDVVWVVDGGIGLSEELIYNYLI